MNKNFKYRGVSFVVCLLIFVCASCAEIDSKVSSYDVMPRPSVERSPPFREKSVDFFLLDEDQWFRVDEKGDVWKTLDRGGTWKIVLSHPLNGPVVFRFIDKQNGFLLLGNSIWTSSDRGDSWTNSDGLTALLEEKGERVIEFFFLDKKNGWCVVSSIDPELGLFGQIMHTSDGGLAWREQPIQHLDAISKRTAGRWTLNSISFSDERNGWAVGNAAVVSTSDGGRNWRFRWNLPGSFERVTFRKNTLGVIVEKQFEESLFTSDGGKCWKRIQIPEAPCGGDILLRSNGSFVYQDCLGKIMVAQDHKFEWRPAKILSDSWNNAVSESDFHSGYLEETTGGSLVCVLLDKEDVVTHLIVSRDGGLTWTE